VTTLRSEPLPSGRDAEAWFGTIADLPGAVFLDSGCDSGRATARRDVMAAQPASIHCLPAQPDRAAVDHFFAQLARRAIPAEATTAEYRATGLIGFCGYDAGLLLHGLGAPTVAGRLPAAWVGDYAWAIVCDRSTGQARLQWRDDCDPEALARVRARLAGPVPASAAFRIHGRFKSNLNRQDYGDAMDRIGGYIDAGDCYQVNLARRFEAGCEGDGWAAYRALRHVARAPFSAFLRIAPGLEVFCLSPERFLAVEAGRVSTSPIKGTRPRGGCDRTDTQFARDLMASEKDRAENLMIVDLLRNDIGRSCDYGSVRCERLFELESYATVHHMVSTITGRLRRDLSWVDLFRDAFPGGSITGAPKRRAMQIIAELEPDARQVYCGSFLHAADSGHFDSNIAIRTLVRSGQHLYCWGGGGIVADSQPDSEFEETEHKIGALLERLLEGCDPQ